MKIKSYIISAIFLANVLAGQCSPLTNDVPFGESLTFSVCLLHDIHQMLPFTSDKSLYYKLHNNYFTSVDDTNLTSVKYLAFPYPQTFDFHLFDGNGKEVRRTLKGWYDSQEAKIPKHCDDMPSVSIVGSDYRPLFVPSDMFAIKDAGTYVLEVRMKICVPLTNGAPDIKAMTAWRDIHVSPINPHYPNTNWGILTSTPVRVKIIKE